MDDPTKASLVIAVWGILSVACLSLALQPLTPAEINACVSSTNYTYERCEWELTQ